MDGYVRDVTLLPSGVQCSNQSDGKTHLDSTHCQKLGLDCNVSLG